MCLDDKGKVTFHDLLQWRSTTFSSLEDVTFLSYIHDDVDYVKDMILLMGYTEPSTVIFFFLLTF